MYKRQVYTSNFSLNFTNVPNEAGFVYTAQVIINQSVATSGSLNNIQINGQTATKYGAFGPGAGYDVMNIWFFLEGATWKVFLKNSNYSS